VLSVSSGRFWSFAVFAGAFPCRFSGDSFWWHLNYWVGGKVLHHYSDLVSISQWNRPNVPKASDFTIPAWRFEARYK
jgi:hypothetical protein